MIEKTSEFQDTLALIHPKTGEMIDLEIKGKNHITYYSIKKLNSRIDMNNLFTIMANACSSTNDLRILGILFSNTNKVNLLKINITDTASLFGTSRKKMSNLINDSIKNNIFIRVKRNMLFLNPFLMRAKGMNNYINELAQHFYLGFENALNNGLIYPNEEFQEMLEIYIKLSKITDKELQIKAIKKARETKDYSSFKTIGFDEIEDFE